MNGKDLYSVYGSVVDFKNYQGNAMPEWEALPEKIQLAWNTVSDYSETMRLNKIALEIRELSQIEHAIGYAEKHADAGVPGHGQFMLIAKLAKALGYK